MMSTRSSAEQCKSIILCWSHRHGVNYSSQHPRLILLLGCFFVHFFQLCSAQQVTACSPSNETAPIHCDPSNWVRVTSEFYVPQVAGSGSGIGASNNCLTDLTGSGSNCNVMLSSGFETNCNGPIGLEPCRENVDFDYAREQNQCLRNVSEVAALVQYSCVKDTDILDLCDTTSRLTSQFDSSIQIVHLASPAFPTSSSSGNLCSCTLQGSRLRVYAVQVSVAARLPWHSDVANGSDYEAVLAIRSEGETAFKSNCAGCTSVNLINTLLVSTGLRHSELTITYSDFGLEGQNVWLEITELGPDLNISCRSTPLPTERIITTTTIAAAATTVTATPPAAAPPSTVTATPFKTTERITTDSKGRRGGTKMPRKDGGGDSGDSTVVVVLVVLLLLLLTAGGVLGFILYRRRGQCGADGKKGLKPMVHAWFRDLQCCRCLQTIERSPADGQDSENHRAEAEEFDSAAVAGGVGGNGSRRPVSFTNEGFSDDNPHSEKDDNKPKKRNLEIVQTEDGEKTIIQNEVYQAHRELVEGEVARIKQHKREQRAHVLKGTLGDTVDLKDSLQQSPSHDHPVKYSSISAYSQVQATSLDYTVHAVDTKSMNDHEESQGLGHPDQEYAVLHHYEPLKSQPEQQSSSQSHMDEDVQEHLYEDIRKVDGESVHKNNPYLGKENSVANEVNHSKPRYKNLSFDLEEPKSRRASGRAALERSSNMDESSPTDDLLSPEERDMFIALGLAGERLDTSSNVTALDHAESVKGRNPSDLNLQSGALFSLKEKDNDQSETFGNVQPSLKTKRAQESNLVSDILELSLQNIKGKRTGQGSDEGSEGGESDGREAVLDLQGQVQMTEC